MKSKLFVSICLIAFLGATLATAPITVLAQEGSASTSQETANQTQDAQEGAGQETTAPPSLEETTERVKEKIDEFGQRVDQSEKAHELKQSVLEPIYQFAEYLAFPAFYWVAFALMVAGVVSFAGQLVLTKFFLLFKMSLNIKELLSDLLGLAISAVGLVLTTQAATENSTFTQSAFAVLSSAAVGVVLGILFYIWGQSQEFKAVEGKRKRAAER